MISNVNSETENLITSKEKSNVNQQTDQMLGESKNIDFDFILEQEGFETKGYVPDAKSSKSESKFGNKYSASLFLLESYLSPKFNKLLYASCH